MIYITDSKIENFIDSMKELFKDDDSLKIELMRCIGEHPNGSKEQLFFLKVFEEVFCDSRLPVVNPFSRDNKRHHIYRIDREIECEWKTPCNNASDAHFRTQRITKLQKEREQYENNS